MPSTFSQNLRLELIGSGEQSGVWGVTTNNNLGDLVEQAISGATVLDVTLADITLTALNGVVDQARSAVLRITGAPSTTRTITIPNVSKTYTVKNRSDSTVNIKTASGSPFAIPTLSEAYIYCDANNVITGRIITDGAEAFNSNPTPLNNLALTGVPTAPTAAVTTNTNQIATTAFVRSIIPAGVIMMWSGSIASIPAGWLLCNGSNGTPDLRDRFVVGAGSSYAPGNTGGANTVTLTESQIPSHTHTGTTASASTAHTHTFTTGTESQSHTHAITVNATNIDHTHGFSATTGGAGGHSHTGSGTTSSTNVDHTHSGSTAGANVDHTHTFSATTGSAGDHSHTVADPGHTHNYDQAQQSNYAGGGNIFRFVNVTPNNGTTTSSQTGISINSAGAHTHSVSGTTSGFSTNHAHAFTTGGMSANAAHTHTYSFTTSSVSNHTHSVSGTSGAMNSNASHTHSASSGNASQTHTHSGTTGAMSANSSHIHTFTTNATGGGQAHENRPPYYALAYIMKS